MQTTVSKKIMLYKKNKRIMQTIVNYLITFLNLFFRVFHFEIDKKLFFSKFFKYVNQVYIFIYSYYIILINIINKNSNKKEKRVCLSTHIRLARSGNKLIGVTFFLASPTHISARSICNNSIEILHHNVNACIGLVWFHVTI